MVKESIGIRWLRDRGGGGGGKDTPVDVVPPALEFRLLDDPPKVAKPALGDGADRLAGGGGGGTFFTDCFREGKGGGPPRLATDSDAFPVSMWF